MALQLDNDATVAIKSGSKSAYEAEVLRTGCTVESNSNLVYDPRYSPSGLFSTIYQVQNDNGVLDILEDR